MQTATVIVDAPAGLSRVFSTTFDCGSLASIRCYLKNELSVQAVMVSSVWHCFCTLQLARMISDCMT